MEKLTTQTRDWKSALKQRDVALADFNEVNAALIEERSALAKAECALKTQESAARQAQSKADAFKAELKTTLAGKCSLSSTIEEVYGFTTVARRERGYSNAYNSESFL